ncbi:MAG: hypothetical protein FWD94_06990 [Treponema sp.]|nr:hypothetical protein [Treponema sp.]
MENFLQILFLTIGSSAILWLLYGFMTGFGRGRKAAGGGRNLEGKPENTAPERAEPADPKPRERPAQEERERTCPVCQGLLTGGELVKTQAYPSITGGRDRLMHIQGCAYCLAGGVKRSCPVCGASLDLEEKLVARIASLPGNGHHIHILGCFRCRGELGSGPGKGNGGKARVDRLTALID